HDRSADHADLADHSEIEVIIDQACKKDFAWLGELPRDHPRLSGRDARYARLIVLHPLWILSHHRVVVFEVLHGPDDHLVHLLSGVYHDEPDHLAGPDLDFLRREAVRVEHLHEDG